MFNDSVNRAGSGLGLPSAGNVAPFTWLGERNDFKWCFLHHLEHLVVSMQAETITSVHHRHRFVGSCRRPKYKVAAQ